MPSHFSFSVHHAYPSFSFSVFCLLFRPSFYQHELQQKTYHSHYINGHDRFFVAGRNKHRLIDPRSLMENFLEVMENDQSLGHLIYHELQNLRSFRNWFDMLMFLQLAKFSTWWDITPAVENKTDWFFQNKWISVGSLHAKVSCSKSWVLNKNFGLCRCLLLWIHMTKKERSVWWFFHLFQDRHYSNGFLNW